VITAKLQNFKARREGIVLVPYRDRGVWSVGCGHAIGKERPASWPKVTIQSAIQLLKQDILERWSRIEKAVKVPLAQHKKDALLDTYYQGGNDGLDATVAIINDRDPDDKDSCLTSDREAARELLQWDTAADGTHLEGLLKRCGLRVAMYTAEEYGSDLSQIPYWERVDEATGRPVTKEMLWYKVQPGDFVDFEPPQKKRT